MGTATLEINNDSGLDPDHWDRVCQACYSFLYDITPVDEGTCRDSLDMDKDDDWARFHYSVAYASYLDEGWSNQAPDGMFGPLLKELSTIVADTR